MFGGMMPAASGTMAQGAAAGAGGMGGMSLMEMLPMMSMMQQGGGAVQQGGAGSQMPAPPMQTGIDPRIIQMLIQQIHATNALNRRPY